MKYQAAINLFNTFDLSHSWYNIFLVISFHSVAQAILCVIMCKVKNSYVLQTGNRSKIGQALVLVWFDLSKLVLREIVIFEI